MPQREPQHQGEHCSSNSRIDQKLTHKQRFECNGESKHDGRCTCELLCWLLLSSCVDFIISLAPASSQTKLINNHQKRHSRGCEVNLPSYPLPYFSHKECIDSMGLKSPTCFYTWPFIFINASFPEDNNFVDAMGLLSPTCFSNLLVTHIQGAGLGNEGRVWLGFLKTFLTVNFLDMTISIQDSIISTKTYQKEGNPYLYINPSSAHPPGMIKGVIFGSIKFYFEKK